MDASRWTSVGLMLANCLRRWPNNKPTLVKRMVARQVKFKFAPAIADGVLYWYIDCFVYCCNPVFCKYSVAFVKQIYLTLLDIWV